MADAGMRYRPGAAGPRQQTGPCGGCSATTSGKVTAPDGTWDWWCPTCTDKEIADDQTRA